MARFSGVQAAIAFFVALTVGKCLSMINIL